MPAAPNDQVQPADINLPLIRANENRRIGIGELLKSVDDMSAPATPRQTFNHNSDSGQRLTSLTPDPDNAIVITHVSGGTGGAGGSGGREGGSGGVGKGPSFQATNMHVMIQKQSAEDREIINWTSPINFFPRQADILAGRQPGTGEWLLQESLFKRWKACEIRALWCHGMPGAGKTVLASIVVDHLQTNLAEEKAGVAVLYLDHRATETQSPTNLLAALWHQLACERPVSSRVHEIYKKHYPRGMRPSRTEVDCVLGSVISEYKRVFIIVDALDEYPEELRNTLLHDLWNLGPAVRLMLTSRPHISIDHIILNIESLEIRANEEDIRKYLEGQIRDSPRLSRHIQKSPALRELIEDKIVKRSDGMFLLAKLHIDSIVNKLNVAAIQDALNKLSTNLHGAYHDIVERINRASEEERQLAWRTLSWVLNAKTPLRHSWLQAALAVDPDSTELDPNRQTDIDLILSLCAGLVVIDKVDDKVRLIHYTTQTYLQDHVHTSMFPRPPSEITLTCFTYMSLVFRAFPNLLRNEYLLFTYNPFLHYAVEYCLVHARGRPEIDVKGAILSFLADCTVWWRLWNWKHGGRQSPPDKLQIALAFHLEQISSHIIQQDGPGNLLQEAASRGATDTVRILLRNGASEENEGGALQEAVTRGHQEIVGLLLVHDAEKHCNSTVLQGNGNTESTGLEHRNRYGTSLCQAAWMGNEAIMMLLIQHGADINAKDGQCVSALQAVSWKGHEAAVKLLLKHGVDVNAEGGGYGCALQLASMRGHEIIVKMLLEYGANINGGGGKHGNALQSASERGHEPVVRVLLKHGVDVNAAGGEYGSALQAASWEGHEGIVRLLLEHGADINAADGEYGSALEGASRRGHAAVVKLLLQHTDINARGAKYDNILQAASEEGHEAVVKMILELSTEVNAGDGKYSSMLQVASERGHEALVRVLLEHGVDVNAGGGEYGSALQAASWNGHEAIVRLLLELGANVNARIGKYGNSLQAASWHGHGGVVKVLLEHGADVNAGGGKSCTALQLASVRGHQAVVELLLSHGADVNAADGEYGSALQLASERGHEAVVKLLLDIGADVNASYYGGGALQLASARGHVAVVELLLEYGADVNAEDDIYGSALQSASMGGHEAVVKLLLRFDADVNAENGMYGSALQLASAGGHEAIVNLLLYFGRDIDAEDGM
ncbi:Ankyrin repeat domain containing protein [Mycena sanguinolenta]|uniref:Ankyrin repeat domain containing protein n=1 Tax=Mycena sanguinolenta TaxID=230812 RepID=A0A8H6ZN43_9AGAR|nr:Ankyrin repeat domain containing protein [Mycena sanguinolenta]